MTINVEVSKSGTENSANLLRRFSRKIQEAGIITRVKSRRYKERDQSHFKIKRSALELIKRRKEVAHLIKIGKMVETRRGRRRS